MNVNNNLPVFNLPAPLGIDDIPTGSSRSESSRSGPLDITIADMFRLQIEMNQVIAAVEERINPNNE